MKETLRPCRFYGECRLAGGLSPRICHGDGTITTLSAVGYVNGRCGRFAPMPDTDALMKLAKDVEDQLSRATADERNCLTVTAEAFADIAQRIRRACGEPKA